MALNLWIYGLILILANIYVLYAADSCEKSLCANLGTAICKDPNYAKFVKENCCLSCAPFINGVQTVGSSLPTTITVPVTVSCDDKEPNCASFGLDVCTNPSYAGWVVAHCAKHCKICDGGIKVTTVIPKTTTFSGYLTPEITTVGVSTAPCVDAIPNCDYYSINDCLTYPDWAQSKCPKYCNLCSRGKCVDKINTCANYGSDICVTYRDWALDHCAKFCSLCPGNITPSIISSNTLQTTQQPTACVDRRADCQNYHVSVCNNRQYTQWAKENCAKHCNMCGKGCYHNGAVYKQNESFKDGCKFKCTCHDEIKGRYQCSSLCYQWQLPSQCTLLPPKPGKCCKTPSCPSNVHLTYPDGYTEE